jgi:dual specificity protein kinase YAK1
MDSQQWTPYATEAPAAARPRYNMASPQHAQRDDSVPAQAPKLELKQEPYASPMPPSRQGSMGVASGAPSRGPDFNDGDGDVAMEDADPYKPKYNAARPPHQHRHSQQFLQQEESAAARRYSPMNLSPTSPYPGAAQQGQSYTSFSPQAQPQSQPPSNRQSPTRTNPYMSPPNSYYSPPCTSRPRCPRAPTANSRLQPPARMRPSCRRSSPT